MCIRDRSRNTRLLCMPRNGASRWSFLTNHAQVLLCIAHDPGIRLREIGEAIGITERAAHRIVVELAEAGYISRKRNGRRNQYTIKPHLPPVSYTHLRAHETPEHLVCRL